MTADPAAGRVALAEVRQCDRDARLCRWLVPGMGLVDLSMEWDALVARMQSRPPVFCRHLCPVQAQVALEQDASDLERLAEAARGLYSGVDSELSFSVQTRLVDSAWPYRAYDVNALLSSELTERGCRLDVRRPEQVLSVVLSPQEAYLGLSRVRDNLSDWAGGERRFKREKDQISRAEFKLLEAMELFALTVPEGGTVLDLGAAPGGWTRILRQRLATVVAVDPADLDERLGRDRGVLHVRQLAQVYLKTHKRFDIIVNDMRMDATESAHVMNSAAKNLSDEGWAVMTLKLPKRGFDRAAASAMDLLRESFVITGARQLFHNRSEITVALRRSR